MSGHNVEIVRKALTDFLATGELDWKRTDEQVEIHDHDLPDAGEYRGSAGVQRWLQDWEAAWEDWSMEPQEFIDAGDQVVAIVHMTAKGRGSGIQVDRQDGLVYSLRDGRILRIDYYNSRDQALDTVRLSG